MGTKQVKAALVLLLLTVFLTSASSVVAWTPRQSSETALVVLESGLAEDLDAGKTVKEAAEKGVSKSELMWVPSGSTPGFYAARDNRNVDPDEYNIVGGHQSVYWDDLEPTEGNYQWSHIENFVNVQVANGKRAALGLITYNANLESHRSNPNNPPLRTPDWVFAAGAGYVTVRYGVHVPKYWDPIYLAKYENFVTALANQYDGDPRIEFIQIGVGRYGETFPCDKDDEPYVEQAMIQDGHTQWTWAYMVNDIVDIYARHFHQTHLLLPNAPIMGTDQCGRRTFTDHAISKGVGLFPAGKYAMQENVDWREYAGRNGCGKFDRLLDQAGTDDPWVPVSFEMYDYMVGGYEGLGIPPDPRQFYWAVVGALSLRPDYITMERNVLYQGEYNDPVVTPYTEHIEIMGWAGRYMGKHIDETPSVWVALRETGYPPGAHWWPQTGNYNWWLAQDDSIAQGRTVPTTYRLKPDMVQSQHYDAYGDAAVNPAVETGQSFLGPSREGWICRRTDQAGNNRYMWFKIDDRYIYGGASETTITVTYFDRGYDTWQLAYDAIGDAYRVAGTITKTNSNTWKQAIFNLADAWFGNMQLGGADFRIDCMGDGDEYIHMVDVRAGGSPSQVHNISLTAGDGGWNFVSTRLVPPSTAIAAVLASIAGKYDLVQAYANGVWRSYQPGIGGDLTTIDQAMGFWVHATQNCTLSVSGQAPTSTTMHLSTASGGWNMIGWPSDDARNIGTALAGIAGNYDMVYAYNAYEQPDPWKIYNPSAPAYASDLQQMSSGWAFWVHVTSNCDLVVAY